ncbi:hypothetical protein V3C33_08430 [Micrococcaceae bacterium Sec5.7]
MTTDTAARQPKGIPVGGQFAATAHAEPTVGLTDQGVTSPKTIADRYLERDAVQNRRRRLHEYWPSGGPEVVRVSAVVGIPIGVGERQRRCG